jgi:DNA-binding GntR family transcriptional regulator
MTQPRRRSSLVTRLSPERAGPSQGTILDELRRQILDGAAPPGSPIPLDDVARHFGVSLIPVREALRTLIGEGLVEHRPRSGYTVARLTPHECAELYVVRAALEATALRAAVVAAGPADDALVLASQQRSLAAIEADDAATYHRESRNFHFALLAPAKLHRLLHLFEVAWNITEPAQLMTQVLPGDRTVLFDDHQQMLEAFLERDIDALLAASQAHHDRLGEVILSLPAGSGAFAPAELRVTQEFGEAAQIYNSGHAGETPAS